MLEDGAGLAGQVSAARWRGGTILGVTSMVASLRSLDALVYLLFQVDYESERDALVGKRSRNQASYS
jgi:hypothetical protein